MSPSQPPSPEPAEVHRYAVSLAWEGSTGAGYRDYQRTHRVQRSGGQGLSTSVSADPAFLGDASTTNPEELLLAAASSCQLLSFLAVAARARLDIVGYADEAAAEMDEADPPLRITRITLRPTVSVRDDGRGEALVERVERLMEVAHRECFIARSLSSPVIVQPRVELVARAPREHPL